MDNEQRIRAAAQELYDAIDAGRQAGYRTDWPGSAAGLPGIGISEIDPAVERVALVAMPLPVSEPKRGAADV